MLDPRSDTRGLPEANALVFSHCHFPGPPDDREIVVQFCTTKSFLKEKKKSSLRDSFLFLEGSMGKPGAQLSLFTKKNVLFYEGIL